VYTRTCVNGVAGRNCFGAARKEEYCGGGVSDASFPSCYFVTSSVVFVNVCRTCRHALIFNKWFLKKISFIARFHCTLKGSTFLDFS